MSASAPLTRGLSSRASSAAARVAPRPAPDVSAPAPTRLRVVDPVRVTAGRLPFALLVGAVLGAGLLSLLLLHTLAAQDGFRLHDLQRQAAALSDTEQQLSVTDQQAQAPSELAARARALGLVPATSMQVVKRHGRTVAVVTAPAVVATPAAQPTARASARPSAHPSAAPPSTSAAALRSAATGSGHGSTGAARPKPSTQPTTAGGRSGH